MRSRPSILIAAIFGILPLCVLSMCSNPLIEKLIEPDPRQKSPKNGPEIVPVDPEIVPVDPEIIPVDPEIIPGDGPEIIAVTSVSLDTTGLTLAVSGKEILTAIVLPEDATNQDVTWSSGNPSVATVDSASGEVTAVAEGDATITVTTVSGGKTASCEVTVVVPVTGVSLNLTTLTPLVSETETLTAGVQPENATNQNVTWTSSDDLVAAVNDNGEVTALTAGSVTITVTTVDGNHSANCTVTVRESTGGADAPFLIYNELKLRQVGTGTDGWILSVYYKLMADITLTQGEWMPIGDNSSGNVTTRFTGSFDGNNKTITGMNIDKPNADYQGMFGYIGIGGEVKNLTLLDCNVNGKDNVGGVVGYNSGTITNSYAGVLVSGTSRIGGLVGYNFRGMVENSHATGDVSGTSRIGGVVGYNLFGTVENSHATGDVSGIEGTVGGVAGGNGNGTLINCYATGDVSGTESVGGVVGYNDELIANCYATGNVSGEYNVGGVVGLGIKYNRESLIVNCYSTGNVRGIDYVGGVVGTGFNGSIFESMIANCYATGNVSGEYNAGGVVGYSQNGTVENCVALNPNINCTSMQYGRIGIKTANTGKFANNYAVHDMKLNNGTATWTNNISDKNGADITTADYQLQSWWSSCAGFDFGATWEWDNASQLPVLYSGGSKE